MCLEEPYPLFSEPRPPPKKMNGTLKQGTRINKGHADSVNFNSTQLQKNSIFVLKIATSTDILPIPITNPLDETNALWDGAITWRK